MEPKDILSFPIAVCEVHLDRTDDEIRESFSSVAGYCQAYVILRFRGVVVGQIMLPVIHEEISVKEVRRRASQVAWPIWQLYVDAEFAPTPPQLSRQRASVVVCTRNRTDDLRRCLAALVQLASQDYEVIVVDNCPSDDSTEKLVATYPQVHYIYEPRAGLDVARNRGIRAATGEIVAFTDDDAQVEPAWLNALLHNFDDPTVAVVTGLTLPLELETPAQCWFEHTNSFSRGYSRKCFDSGTTGPLASGRVGAGVNMAIRRNLLDEIGMFDEALDGGTITLSGGDQEFFYRTLARGYRIVYEPAAVVRHKHRRDWKALRHTIYGYGVGLFAWWTCALLKEKELTLLIIAPTWFLQHHVRELLRSLFRRHHCVPLDLAWAEFCGALIGPWRYLWARHQARQQLQASSRDPSYPISSKQRTAA
jgi:glycosyltransferase involved in cell wall biosynthesis